MKRSTQMLCPHQSLACNSSPRSSRGALPRRLSPPPLTPVVPLACQLCCQLEEFGQAVLRTCQRPLTSTSAPTSSTHARSASLSPHIPRHIHMTWVSRNFTGLEEKVVMGVRSWQTMNPDWEVRPPPLSIAHGGVAWCPLVFS